MENKRELVGVFLNILTKNTRDGTFQHLRTLSRTLIDSPRATRSYHRATVETL